MPMIITLRLHDDDDVVQGLRRRQMAPTSHTHNHPLSGQPPRHTIATTIVNVSTLPEVLVMPL